MTLSNLRLGPHLRTAWSTGRKPGWNQNRRPMGRAGVHAPEWRDWPTKTTLDIRTVVFSTADGGAHWSSTPFATG